MEPESAENSSNTSFLSASSATFLVVLVLVALVLGYFLYQNVTYTTITSPESVAVQTVVPKTSTTTNTPMASSTSPDQMTNLPVPQNHPSVESVESVDGNLRYFFGGIVKEIKPSADGTGIVLENSTGLPPITLEKTSNPQAITLVPGGPPNIKAVTHDALKQGMYVQALMYYHIESGTWTLRDVYIPSEKNK